MSSTVVLQVDAQAYLDQLITGAVEFLPVLLGAILILVIGWVIGSLVGRVVRRVMARTNMDTAVFGTPLGRMLGQSEQGVSRAFGSFTKYFIFALAILAAANVLNIALLSEWISTAVTYLPALAAGLFVIVLGFIVADFIGDAIERTEAATNNAYTDAFATGVRLFLYFVVVVIGLSTMGIDTTILQTFAQALSWGVAAAIAIGAGVAIGWGGKDFVAQNIDRWARTVRSTSRESIHHEEGMAADGGGED